ncbi:unnamed protein product [Sphagnum balticum]
MNNDENVNESSTSKSSALAGSASSPKKKAHRSHLSSLIKIGSISSNFSEHQIRRYVEQRRAAQQQNDVASHRPHRRRVASFAGRFLIHFALKVADLALALGGLTKRACIGFTVHILLMQCFKAYIGRLRPNFIAMCKPNWKQIGVDCMRELPETLISNAHWSMTNVNLSDVPLHASHTHARHHPMDTVRVRESRVRSLASSDRRTRRHCAREHAAELNNPVPTKPMLFMKATSAYIGHGDTILVCRVPNHILPVYVSIPLQLPVESTNVSHEVELGVVIGRRMKRVPADQVMQHIGRILLFATGNSLHKTLTTASTGGYVLALDMTCRDWQDDAKKQGHPWFLSKSFDTSCPVGDFIETSQIPVRSTAFSGNFRTTFSRIHTIYITMEPGDVLLTGTPAGVSQVRDGDRIKCDLRVNDRVLSELSVGVQNE